MAKWQKIVTIGGGTGSFTLLSSLKEYPIDITAIVSMADDGGSTGVLRDEFGVLPPGDIRQCLVALSESDMIMREIFNFRFPKGSLKGHNFGNIFLSTLEMTTGSFDKAVKELSNILKVRGNIVPVVLSNIKLVAELNNGKRIVGEQNVTKSNLKFLRRMSLSPRVKANPEAIKAIRNADKVIINPGNLYSSVIPNFLAKGIPDALKKTRAKIIYVCNLMTKKRQTEDFSVVDFAKEIEKYIGEGVIDYVIYNKAKPNERLLKKYSKEGKLVKLGDVKKMPIACFKGYDLISKHVPRQLKADKIKRTLIRHDSNKIARILYNL